MKKILLMLPLLFWLGCEEEKEDADESGDLLCTSETEAMNNANEALESAEGIEEITAAIVTFCETIDALIQCMSASPLFTQEDVDGLQASYDQICGD